MKKRETKDLMVPTVHNNGTSRDWLQEEFRRGYIAIGDAIRVIQDIGPNARDYYVQGEDAIRKATAQHLDRLQTLQDLQAEYKTIYDQLEG